MLTRSGLTYASPEAKGSNPTAGFTLFWARNLFRGNFNHWQVSRKEAGQIFFKRQHSVFPKINPNQAQNNIQFKFNNCPTRYDLFSLLHFCRQLYMFRVLTPIIRSSYNCNYSFWHWSTRSATVRSGC